MKSSFIWFFLLLLLFNFYFAKRIHITTSFTHTSRKKNHSHRYSTYILPECGLKSHVEMPESRYKSYFRNGQNYTDNYRKGATKAYVRKIRKSNIYVLFTKTANVDRLTVVATWFSFNHLYIVSFYLSLAMNDDHRIAETFKWAKLNLLCVCLCVFLVLLTYGKIEIPFFICLNNEHLIDAQESFWTKLKIKTLHIYWPWQKEQ